MSPSPTSLSRLAVSVGLFAGLAGAPALAGNEPLEGVVRASMGNARMDRARVGVAIVDCDTRESLASINAGDLFAPASNLKLITSGVALTILKDFEFKTGFSVTPDGRMIIKGAGDPALCDPKLLEEQGWSVERFIARVVDAARAARVSGIKEIIVDDRVFERDTAMMPPVHPTWPKDQLNRWYCAPVSGLNFFTNVIELRATPAGGAGQKPNVTTEPSAPWLLNLDLSSTRTIKEGGNSLWAQQDRAGAAAGLSAAFSFKVFGDVRKPITDPVEVSVSQPGLLFASLLYRELWQAGMTAGWRGATPPPVRAAAEAEDLLAAQAAPFAVITTPLSTALRRCNVDSQNLYAECLMKRTAYEVTQQPGSWATGSQVMTMRLSEKLGQDAQGVRIVDGSGLSKDNQITPMVMARWLAVMQQDKTQGAALLASMAREDRDRKMIDRFAGRRINGTVYAKTGYIKNVQCLSGYVVLGERTIAYSVLANDVGSSAGRVKDFQEEVVMAIDGWLARQGGLAGGN
ncbi:MAG TPA: D-alanyl-D-alanine carboxypeptidase/D-alanyl-D-alanine-endopeptidase [Phycisphaerales bacterium]|nr:D-alanyl-D-alanine carboxypeptidase/D-alanyl-D-alanine-endopeptidase [Phycisphaerales bacterium]